MQRLDGFYVIWHASLGIYLGTLPPRPQFAYLPFADQVWSFTPNLLQSAPTFRNHGEAEAENDALFAGWELRAVGADIQLGGRTLASMLACVAAGLPPWFPGTDLQVQGYCRTEDIEPLITGLRRLGKPGDKLAEISWCRTPAGLRWAVSPYAAPDTPATAIAPGHGPASGWV